jgi:thioredoxin reductase (NADPH)
MKDTPIEITTRTANDWFGRFESTPYATSVRGLYAVGDVRTNSVKRVASAVGEGSVVISDIHRYLADHRNRFAVQPDSALEAIRTANAH